MPSLFSFLLCRGGLGLLVMLALFPSMGMGGSIKIGPSDPPTYEKVYVESLPLKSATLNLNIPSSGVVEMDAAEAGLFQVSAVGTPNIPGVERSYSWSSDHAVAFHQGSSEGSVYLSWKWNGQVIANFAQWIQDGNPGKGGTYTVSLMQSATYRYQSSSSGSGQYPSQQYSETQVLRERSFELVIRGHQPLAAGVAPKFLSVPELGEMTVVPDEGLPLRVEANAGGGFRFHWYRSGSLWSNQKNVRVYPKDVPGVSQSFYCEVSGPTGRAVTRAFHLRQKVPPRVDFSASVSVVLEGEKVRLEPKAVAESPMTFSWSGPALSAGGDRARVLGDGTLEISAARAEDAGDYVLRVDNGEIPVSHSLQVSVLRLPSGVYPLRAGQRVMVEGGGTNSMFSIRCMPLTLTLGLKYTEDMIIHKDVEVLRARPYLAGVYQCVVEGRGMLPQDYFDGQVWSLRHLPTPVFHAESTFELKLPSERPVMSAHALPPGYVGQEYYRADPPMMTARGESVATHFGVTGLPPGLKAKLSGEVYGAPTKAGDFQVKFTAVNGQGRASAVVVPLHIAPLPEGVVGDWVAFCDSGEWDSFVFQMKITPRGAFTGRWLGGKPVRGLVVVDDSGVTELRVPHGDRHRFLKILPATHVAEFYESTVHGLPNVIYGHGWRHVWGPSAPAGAYEGSYSVDAAALGLEVPAKDRTGQVWVKRLGQTRAVTRWSEGSRSMTSNYFLGPQRQILHRWLDVKAKPSTRSKLMHLVLDESGESALVRWR